MSERVQIRVDDDMFRGERATIIGVLEAKGHAAQRENECPHKFWQAAEHLKRKER